ncbi:MAG TPA: hypothetical protein VL326_20420 [Kofleriaceae bacterium]|jgi:hypothetical protein|nr:hypothetical protein [Kofleriaceae bacterium]
MEREDYIHRLIRQFAEALAKIAGLRDQRDYKRALAATEDAWEGLVGHPRSLVNMVDTPTLAQLLGQPEKMRMAAKLLWEEGKTLAASGDPIHATICYRSAVELVLEARAIAPSEEDSPMLFELGRVVQMNQLDPLYRTDD